MSAAAQLADDLAHIIDRHVPDMGAHGFTITTSHGPLHIDAGRLADRIADLVAQDARLALMRLEATLRDEVFA